MKEIRIGPAVQVLVLLAFLGLVGSAVYAELPGLRRYLKLRAM
jgi:hypothetical protein